jgi:plastocyanin
MRKVLLLAALLGAAMACGTGCGGGTTGGTTSNSGGAGGGTGGSGGGTGGGTGGSGGTTSTGGGDLINGCDAATAEDHLADAVATIAQVGTTYKPPCIKIKAGNSVKFTATFTAHPLVGGLVEMGAKVPDAASPITKTSDGTEATFKFDTAGSYGFYCDFHALTGMKGVIFVE